MSEKICKNCWQFTESNYSAYTGKCELEVYNRPYGDTQACDEFEDKWEED